MARAFAKAHYGATVCRPARPPTTPTPHPSDRDGAGRRPAHHWFLSLAALGVVYGDIGTSPLYAVRESVSGHFGVAPLEENVLGILSLITWSLLLVVSVKYLGLVLRADNHGEGGVLALVALAASPGRTRRRGAAALGALGVFGAALLFGDGVLTPAISVLSAMEGLRVAAPRLEAAVVPLTLAILVGLFLVQRGGTARVGTLFAPVTVAWFLVLAVLGLNGILRNPDVLVALHPVHAVRFLASAGTEGLLVLGAVFLVVTGAEALYADLGHFGAGPIRVAWFALVLPALLLNYFGQGALVLADPAAVESPFYLLAPDWARVPLLVLATAATIIASQAVITGVFSLTRQAVQLGLWPRTEIRHTSALAYGQIYAPGANWALAVLTVLVVVGFRSSAALAAAYGIAIVTTMLVTTALLYVVAPRRWGWPRPVAWTVLTVFLAIELAFFAANLAKVHEGGWVPLALAGVLFVLAIAWQAGRRALARRLATMLQPLDRFLAELDPRLTRVPGTAVYMTGNPGTTPPPLVKNLEHQQTLHERVLLVTVLSEALPHVHVGERVALESLNRGFHRVTVRYGFMEKPDIPEVFEMLRNRGLDVWIERTTFFLGRERLLTRQRAPWAQARVALFAFMARNSQRATAFFNIPPDRVVEVGSQIEL